MNRVAAALTGLILLTTVACGDPAVAEPAAPDFEIDLLDGSRFGLQDHIAETGQPVVVNLWASWCRPCRREMPSIDRVASAHPEITFIGVAVQDSRQAATDFANEIEVGYLIGFDEGDAVNDLFLVPGLPMTVFIDSSGAVAGRSFGEMTDQDLEDRIALFIG